MGITISSLGQAAKYQSAQKSKARFGAKNLVLGKEYELLFRKNNGDVIVSGMAGRQANFDELGIGFVRLFDDQLEENPETGRITDRSSMRQWSIISSILFHAAEKMEIEEFEENAKKTASRSGVLLNPATLEQGIEDIHNHYHYNKDSGVKAEDMRRPLLSAGIQFNIITEVLVVPLIKDNGNAPDYKNARVMEISLSPAKQRQIAEVISNPVYNDMDDPDGFLHVKFSYIGTNAQEAGKKEFQGLESVVRKVNLAKDADGVYVDAGVASIAPMIDSIAKTSEAIYISSNAVAYASTTADLDVAMKKYLSNCILLTYVDFTSDIVKKNATMLKDWGIFNPESKQYKELLEVIANEGEDSVAALAEEAKAAVENDATEALEIAKSTTVTEAVNAINNATQEFEEIDEI